MNKDSDIHAAHAARGLAGVFVCVLAFVLTGAPAPAAKLEVLHEFSSVDGTDPVGGLMIDTDTGVLYGTAQYGGSGDGTVFSLAPPPPGKKRWKFKTIYTFLGGFDGARPQTGLVMDGLRKLYGTTRSGSSLCDCGTIFRLTQGIRGVWEKELLHEFSGENFDGTLPNSTLFLGYEPFSLYGTTGVLGGFSGTIFRMDPDPGGTLTVLYNPDHGIGNDFVGNHPQGVVVGGDGTIYGTAADGDVEGTVFQIKSSGVGKILHAFNGTNGAAPLAPPIMGPDGTLYGTTWKGGNPKDCPSSPGCGTVWKKPPASREKVLHSFQFFTKNHDGQSPISPLVLDEETGTLYGTTFFGGTGTTCGGVGGSCGTVFKIDSDGSYEVLWQFPHGGPAAPQGQLVFDAGALYGTSFDGGKPCPDQHYLGCGTIWKLTP